MNSVLRSVSDGSRLELALTPSRIALLAAFATAAVLLIPLHWHAAGAVAWTVAAVLVWRDDEGALRRRVSVLLGCLAVLSATDINTSTSDANFLQVGVPFFLVIIVPALIMAKTDPGVIGYRFFPEKVRRLDACYTILSIPLAWLVLAFYWRINPELYTHWHLPIEPDDSAIRRLFIGINLVGIWDEFFFVNTVFAVLRSLFAFRVANALQAVLYAAVLFDMAFSGIGPLVVFLFAWTQGSMFEKSGSLVWVLAVHLIVDFFLVAAIAGSYYPGYGLDYLWRHGM